MGRRGDLSFYGGVVEKYYFIYILTNLSNTVLYTGVTNNIKRRIFEHKSKLVPGFTYKYNVIKLVYYDIFSSIEDAISREKQIKAGPRKKKVSLINSINPKWNDLYQYIIQ